MDRGPAGFMLNYVAIPFVLFAFPAGIIATKIGRRLTIKIGLVLFIVALFIGFLIPTITVITIAFVIAGIGWALVNINSIVIVWEMARTEKKIGTYTGVYYFFSFMAAIIGPYLVGTLTDLLGKTTLLLDGAIFLFVALILMFFVKRGEVELTEEEKLAKKKAIQEL